MFGASLGSLNLKDLKLKTGAQAPAYRGWEDLYRQKWSWDKVAWGTHCVDCYPGNCPYARLRERRPGLREEQVAGTFPTIEPGVPDMNPMGCQKGASWSQLLDGPERVLHPLRRVGERGEGRWERVSWDEALTEHRRRDARRDPGVGARIHRRRGDARRGRHVAGLFFNRLIGLLGGIDTDVNAEINDFSPGIYLTFGKFNSASSLDDWFHAELILFTGEPRLHGRCLATTSGPKPATTAREVVLIAPDCSPSHVHADYHLPVRPGTDAALALAMCKVIIDERIYDAPFVKEQTDLPLLVRTDTRHFLRAERPGGRRQLDEQFYFFDSRTRRVVEAPAWHAGPGRRRPGPRGKLPGDARDGEQSR